MPKAGQEGRTNETAAPLCVLVEVKGRWSCSHREMPNIIWVKIIRNWDLGKFLQKIQQIPFWFSRNFVLVSAASQWKKTIINIISESVGYAKTFLAPKSPSCSDSTTENPCPVLPRLHHLHPQSLKTLHTSSKTSGLPGSTLKSSSRQIWGADWD